MIEITKEGVKKVAMEFRKTLEDCMGEGWTISPFIPNYFDPTGRVRLITNVCEDIYYEHAEVDDTQAKTTELFEIVQERLGEGYTFLDPRFIIYPKTEGWQLRFLVKVIQDQDYHYESGTDRYTHPCEERC